MSSYYEDIEIRRREDGQLVSLVQITDLSFGEKPEREGTHHLVNPQVTELLNRQSFLTDERQHRHEIVHR